MKRLQAADHRLGVVACAALQPLRWLRSLRRRLGGGLDDARARRVLLIKFWGIGSLQLLTPAVRVLRERHPEASIELLTLSQNGAFARGLGVFDEVRELDVASSSWTVLFSRILRLVRDLRRERYDRVYDYEFFTRFSSVVSLLSGAPELAGFAAPSVWRGGFHTSTVPFNRYWHVARNFRNLAGGESGLPVAPADLVPFEVAERDRRELSDALAAAEFDPLEPLDGEPLVVLNPNAGSLSLERRWPPERFAVLARRLIERERVRVVLVGAPTERSWTSQVATRLGTVPPGRFANLAGRLSMGGLAALLERADLFVGNDSGPMHLAAAYGTPTVGLFGPETPQMYAPLGTRARALYRPPACSPCINVHENKVSSCVRGHPECLTNLEVELVHDAAQELLACEPVRLVPRPLESPATSPREVGA